MNHIFKKLRWWQAIVDDLKKNNNAEKKPRSSKWPTSSNNPKPKKFRWKPFVISGAIIGLIILILYFIFGFGKPTVIQAKGFSIVQNSRSNNQKAIVIQDVNNNNWYIPINNTKGTSVQTLSPFANFNQYWVYTKANGSSNVAFRLSIHTFENSVKYNISQTSLVESFSSGSSGNGSITTKDQLLNESKSNNNGYMDKSTDNDSIKATISYFKQLQSIASATPARDWVSTILNFVPFLFFLGFFIFIYYSSRKMQTGQDGIFGMGKTIAKTTKTNVTFQDVAGIQEEKEELMEIVDYLKNPSKYAVMGARTPRGVILYGPPGTGKTLLAKAVSGEANVPFFEVSGASFDDMFVGVGAKRVRDLFTKAKKVAPCIIFIDEIDAVAGKRGSKMVNGSAGGIADQTINQLLSEMDGFNTMSGIVIMAATNRLDSLDDAILRPGRFDRHIQVTLPDIKERVEILKIHAKNKNISAKVKLNDVARRTPGFSGAQLENVLNEATLLAVRNNKNVISMHEIDEAIDRVIAGPAKKSRRTTEAERKHIAYHEAGHALAGLYVPGGDVVEKITIIPRGQAAGYTLSAPSTQELLLKTKQDLLSIVTTTLAGRAAEEIIYGHNKITSGASNDFYKVTNIVRSMVTQLGMSDLGLTQYIPSEGDQNPYLKYYSEATAKAIDDEINNIINQQYAAAKVIINEHRDELELIVECLMLLETIVKPQIDYIHEHKKLPKEALDAKAELAKNPAPAANEANKTPSKLS